MRYDDVNSDWYKRYATDRGWNTVELIEKGFSWINNEMHTKAEQLKVQTVEIVWYWNALIT